MTASERERKWISILDAAYSSGEQISDWCDKHGLIPHNRFYYWSKKLGYTKNGKRTEKCPAGNFSSTCEDTFEQSVPSSPMFVDVSPMIHKYTAPALLHQAPPVIIQTGCYQIGVQDGFTPQTLAKVLEVIRDA